MLSTTLIQQMISYGFGFAVGDQTICQSLAITRQDCCDFEPGLFNQVVQEFLCTESTVVRKDFQLDPAASTINPYKQILCVKLHLPFGLSA